MRIVSSTLARNTIACALALLLLAPASGLARTVQQKKKAARAQFDIAERLREALDHKAESSRTRADYDKVMEAYRKVYHTAPTSVKADASVFAVAELLEEQGRILNDPKSFKDAIGQYVFLRREYPGSKFRVEALWAIAEVYRDDLDDKIQSKAAFEDFLKRYPGNAHTQEARKAIAEIDNPSVVNSPFKAKAPRRDRSRSQALRAAEDAPKPPADETAALPAQPQEAAATNADAQPHRMARLTSIRHWSTPDYTRVAIDLEQEVKYQAGRVPHPDRIFFDLYGTRLASELVGKSFEVDAGFLHKIRVAQYKANMARVVLDVDDVAEYSAFLLPNPYRLIIDIHGKLPPSQVAGKKERKNAVPDGTSAAEEKPPARPQQAPSQPTSPQQAGASDAASDVTVTNIRPGEGKQATATRAADAAPTETAETRPASPRGRGKDRDKDKERVVTESPAEVAKVISPKVAMDDAGMDDSEKSAGKPTSGPTFESISPKESSRNKKKTIDPTPRASASAAATSTHTAAPTASGERSLIRALGLKIGKIVVDAGHGGHDTGTIGPNGLQEKDLVLDVALKLGKLLEEKLGAEVVYTRDDDTFIPLETRTAIANKEQADLFISIHANSSDDASARGVETYYLNFTSRADALEVAARENAVSEKSIHELQDLVKKIALKEKIGESREFAIDVQRSLYGGLSAKNASLRNRGVKKAPFVVLIGANMPSILAEISFVSNPDDARKLKTSEYRQRIADSLYKGVARYVNSLSGVKVASKNSGSSAEGQRSTSVAAK
jgi:N-acetylmuramoyl-L-alanine amidase